MKKIYTLIILLMTLQLVAQPPAGSWNLVWEDNFDGNQLDFKKWKLGLHWLGIGGTHLFANSGKSIHVNNGLLTIRAEKQTGTFAGITKEYTSSEISTFNLFKQKYGYFEARIKYDAVQGMWPAFWMMPNRGVIHKEWNQDVESYVKFNINGNSAAVGSAIFKLKVLPETQVNGDQNVTVHKISDNSTWTETNITWATRPAFDPAFLKQFMGAIGGNRINQIVVGSYIEVDVTDYVNAQIAAGKQFAGFAMMDRFMKEKKVVFGSKENSDIVNRPVLVIDGTNIYPSDDAVVKILHPNEGFGTDPNLFIRGRWAKTSKTDNGGMEMDIMESLGVWGDNRMAQTLHWDNYGADHKSATSGRLSLTPTNDGFHTYGMEWAEGEMKFYIDGNLTWTHTNPRVSTVDSYIILSHQVGGWNGSGNTPVADASLPANMVVDYIKVYKNATLAVESFTNKNQILTVTPNPIQDGKLSFKLNSKLTSDTIEISISDILGRNIYRTSLHIASDNATAKIPLEKINLKKGVYILTAKSAKFITSKKFIY